ncbi:MAG: extracellular solute-binding protein [Betaproteobacteria bacterium]|nr:extracellular solute-binding protein [Betaproteobacteria bacterium]
MNTLFVRYRLALLLLGISFAISATGLAQPKPDRTVADIALLQGENRLQTLMEGAKKEGELNVYFPYSHAVKVTDAFTQKYGVKVNNWRSSSENILQRIVSEARGGRFEVDITLNVATEMEALHREKLLQQVRSPHLIDLMPQAIPAHKEWVGIAVEMFVQGYNTAKIRKEELPKTYQDLLDPKWKGRLGIEAADQQWFAYVLQELGQEKGIKLFKDIVATNGMSVRKGHSLLAQMVASGEVPLALTLYAWGPDQLKQKGAPIERFNISQPIAMFGGMGLLKKAPHPHAAVLFYDFMLTDGQEIMSKQHSIATSSKLDVAQKKIPMRFIDPAAVLDNSEKWLQTFDEVFVKRTK